jgi:copper homeostasis protein
LNYKRRPVYSLNQHRLLGSASQTFTMKNHFVLEICVESVESAIAADAGGAHRIELCTNLAGGGTTPSAGLMQSVRKHVRLPVHAMIRPRTGDFCYSNHELEIMRNDIEAAKQAKMDGVVLGILRENTRVDVERTKLLVKFAQPLPTTFHRAFDLAKNPTTALEDVIQTGSSRILTSGGESRATDGLPALLHLVQAAKHRIAIMPCGGINSGNILRIIRATSALEVHTSAGTSHLRSTSNGAGSPHGRGSSSSISQSALLEQKIVKLVNLLANISPDEVVRGE